MPDDRQSTRSEHLVENDSLICDAAAQGRLKPNLPETPTFTAYPNPSRDYVVVEPAEASAEKGVIRMTDLYGRTIKSIALTEGERYFFLLLEGVAPGLYTLNIDVGGHSQTQMVSIIR